MTEFKISFQDINGNELWMSIVEEFNIDDAHEYAKIVLSVSMVNDLAQYEITEF
jgi:hypothetical protein